MRYILILLLTCIVFAGVVWFAAPTALADPTFRYLSNPIVYDISDKQIQAMHTDKAERFVAVKGFGARRVISMFDLNHFPLGNRQTNEYWTITNIDVVGDLKTGPRTYQTKKIVNREDLKDVPTRKLDDFEAKYLERLRVAVGAPEYVNDPRRETARWEPIEGGLRVLGSLRATKGCLECHAVKEGTLLGALSYTLTPVVRDAENAAPVRQQQKAAPSAAR